MPDLSVIDVQKILRRHEAMQHVSDTEGGAAHFLGKDYGMALGHSLDIFRDVKYHGMEDIPFKSHLRSSVMQAERPVLTSLNTLVFPGRGGTESPSSLTWSSAPWFPHTDLANGKKSTFDGSLYGLLDHSGLSVPEQKSLLDDHLENHHFDYTSYTHPNPDNGISEELDKIPTHKAHSVVESHKTIKMPYVGTMWNSSHDSPLTYLNTHSDLNKHWNLQEAIQREAPLGNKLIHVRYNPAYGGGKQWESYAYDPSNESLHKLED